MSQVKAEFQLNTLVAGNPFNLPAGTVFCRLFIPINAKMPGLGLKGRILTDSWKNGAWNGTRKFRVLEFVCSNPADYIKFREHCVDSNLAPNRIRTNDLLKKLTASNVAAVKASQPATQSKPATTKKVSNAEANRRRLVMKTQNFVDAWSTKPGREPFIGNALSIDSPWLEGLPVPVTQPEDVCSIDYLPLKEMPSEEVPTDLSSEYADILEHLTLDKLKLIARKCGLFPQGKKKADYRSSLVVCLVHANRHGRFSLEEIGSLVRSL